MKLSVIIVNYNVKYFLEQALRAVRKAAQHIETEVFVVDNNSVDDSVSMVREEFPEVKLIANKENTGFSVANNQAIKQAKGEYILLLNPDTVVEEDTFLKTVTFMDEHPDAGGLGVKMIDGKGTFLPESKRGFPSPKVAFYKTFGLSRLFPKSKMFNGYHLGYLDKDENHQVDVLSGAFMLLRKSVLDEIGLLDETFFMYGEDIDLSYRIVKAGYKNYYFSESTIIHYKGESTKKGSLNYVRVFYNAMIIFARKHFKGEKAAAFIFMLQCAIYLRAFMTIFSNFAKKAFLPILDALILFVGLYFLKDFWATYVYNNPNYYPAVYMQFNVPLYIFIWLTAVFFSGGYDTPKNFWRLVRGIAFGTLVLAAVYGFLDLEYRTSRALIVLGALWGVISLWLVRLLLHFIKYRNFNVRKSRPNNLVIVGSQDESKRVRSLIHEAEILKNYIGAVAPDSSFDNAQFLGDTSQLDEIVDIYKVNEIVFCSSDVPAQQIMHWMTKLGPEVDYKIVPEKSLSIIGSNSKNSAGDLYTIDIRFRIAKTMNRRNKRLLDLIVAAVLLIGCPLLVWPIRRKSGYFSNIFEVIKGTKTWVGYYGPNEGLSNLPVLKKAVLSPLDALKLKTVNEPTWKRLNYLYAKDFSTGGDLEIIRKGFRELGR